MAYSLERAEANREGLKRSTVWMPCAGAETSLSRYLPCRSSFRQRFVHFIPKVDGLVPSTLLW